MQQSHSADLLTTAAIVAGFGISVFMFRIEREAGVLEKHPGWPRWLAWADYLVIGATAVEIFVVAIPVLAGFGANAAFGNWAAAASAASLVLLAGYFPAILAHYRIAIGRHRTGSRRAGEPWEKLFVVLSLAAAAAVFLWISWINSARGS